MKSTHSIRGRALKVFSAGLVTICATEILLRLLIISPEASVPDSELGWGYMPNAVVLQSSEGYARNNLNSLGLNDDEFVQSGNILNRILVLGDSYTAALQVDRSENFVSLTEAKTCSDMLNAGRDGMTAVHYNVVARRLKPLGYERVVIVFTAGDISDIRETEFEVVKDPLSGKVDHINLRAKTLSKYRQLLSPVFEHSSLFTLLKNRIRLIEADEVKANAIPPKTNESTNGFSMFRSDSDKKEISEIIQYVIKDIQSFADVSILFIPSYEYKAYGESQEKDISVAGRTFFEQLTENLHIPFQAVTTLPEYYKYTSIVPVGFPNNHITGGHLNPNGHKLVAVAMAKLVGNHCKDSGQ